VDADKIKNFFIHHAEKMVVGLVIAASAWMVYSGLSLPDLRDEKDPDQLANEAKQVRASIDDDHSEAVLKERNPTFQIDAELEKKNKRLAAAPYTPDHLLVPRNLSESVRRQDPTLLPPRALMTSGHLESYAVLSNSSNYLASTLEPADELEKIEVKKKVIKPKRPRGRGAMMEMEGMSSDGMSSDGMSIDGMSMEGMSMDGRSSSSSMMGMSSEMGMGMGAVAGAGRALLPEYNFGFSTTSASAQSTSSKHPVPQSAWFIAGTAVIPHKEIANSYRTALFDADGYTPQRDQPLYFNYEIQRADVTNKTIAQLVDADWMLIGNRESDLKRAALQWAGFAPELVPSDYRDLNITGYIPPILLSDYSKFALHPLIPMVSRTEIEQEQLMAEQSKVAEVKAEDFKLAGPDDAGAMDGMNDIMMGSTMDLSMDSDFGMGMGAGVAAGMKTIEENPVDYKIMRFYDFARGGLPAGVSPMPGRKYVYRLRYAVQDPNFPANPSFQPKSSTLGGDVYTRVQGLMTKAEQTKEREFQRWSPWSEPSDPVSLPGFNQYFAGKVELSKPRDFKLAGKNVEVFKSPPLANVLTLGHNAQYASPMPIWMKDVTEGSALSYKGAAEIIDPISLAVKKTPETEVLSGTTIVDLAGGRPLGLDEEEELKQPGMMLLYDETGELRVESEVEDQEKYRIYSFADERGL
jgi:hypothetical protein